MDRGARQRASEGPAMVLAVHGRFEPRESDILWEIERRHLEEAEFVLELWEDALDAPHYTLEELAEGAEQRLLAHVDALAVGGLLVF